MKNLKFIFPVLLMFMATSMVYGQAWTTYQADLDPVTEFAPAFEESNTGGVFERTQIVDPDNASNSLLRIITDQDTDGSSDNYQLRQQIGATTPTAITVVFRAKGNDPTKFFLFDMDMDFNAFRSQIRIHNDGTIDVANGTATVAPDPLTINTQEWNTYRFTRDGDQFALYVNEDPTPVVTGTAAVASTNNYFRFGDGWGSSGTRGISTDFDWVTWDLTGAYSPVDQALPPELVGETPVGNWTLYNADVEPTAFDPAFSESNGNGTYAYSTLVDPDDATNNLLNIKTDLSAAAKDNIQFKQATDLDAVTVVLKARTVDLANKNMLFDMDFRSALSTRFAIKVLNDGTYDIDKGGDGIVPDKGDLGFSSTDWNIFRFTKNGNDVNIYINEDPTPVFTMTAVGTADGSGYWRFGDGWSSEDVDTQYDWVTWDYTGAYAPDQARLPDELVDQEIPFGDWAIYNADVDPTAFDPAFSESNNAGTFTYGILADDYIPGNNLLSIKTDLSAAAKDNIQLRQYTDVDAATVVLKARTIDLANKGLLFDMDFRSATSTRFAIKVLNDGTYDIDKGGDGIVPDKADWGFDATEWNIFRFTKNGNDVNIYINEDPTPVFTMTAVGTADGSGYWRFGDGWSSEDVDTQYDWVTWDYTGAYSPGETRLPVDLVKPPLGDWAVYNADVDPTAFDPAFSESNNAGTFTYGTLVDPDDATNNLLNIKTDLSAAAKDNIQLRQYTDLDAVTVVLKARTIDIANKNMLFDMDFRSATSTRFAIKVLNDGTYDIDKGGDGIVPDKADWGFTSTDWNIFRFTKNGNDVNIYINEDPTPVFTMTAVGTADGSGYWRFGDGWSSEDVDTQYDWVTWDYTGAYAPDQARLPDELTGEDSAPAPAIKTLGSIDPLSQDLGFAPDFTIDTYKLSGTNLTGDITITPPVNFEVSVDTTNWFTNANPLVIVQDGGIVEDTVIIVRLNATAIGDYMGDISNTSPGAEEELVSVSGTTIELTPEITTTGTLESFVQNISTPSASQNYRVSGVNLKDSVLVTAPAGFEISKDDITWGASFKLGGADRTITNALVYVRQFGSAIGDLSGSISHTSLDATEITIDVMGEVISDPGITVTGEFAEFSQSLGTPSASQSYTLSGSSLTSNISISLPDGFEISIDGDLWLNSLTIVPLEGTVEEMTLNIRLNAIATGTSSGNIVHSSIGVEDVNVAVSGTNNDIVLAAELEPNNIAFAIWPNPSSDKITLQRENETGEAKVSIYSLQGELISQYAIAPGSSILELDISTFKNGVYLVGFEGDGMTIRQRFIKK